MKNPFRPKPALQPYVSVAPRQESTISTYERDSGMVFEVFLCRADLVGVKPHALENMRMDIEDYIAKAGLYLHNVAR